MIADDYRVRLDAFEGPLDLLLFLIRKAEVDVHDIPVATITEQYLAYLADLKAERAGRIDIDTAGEFLVMAATLMEIKSRMLMPQGPARAAAAEGDARSEDPRASLVRQLLEYKKYRDAAEQLTGRAEEWGARFPTTRAGLSDAALQQAIDQAQDVEVEDLDVMDLVEAFRKIAESVNFDRLGDHQVTYDDTPIEVHAQGILATLAAPASGADAPAPESEFTRLFVGRKRHEMLGLFLALLELVRKRRVGVRQDRSDGQIYLRLRPDSDAEVAPAEPAPAPTEQAP